MFIVFTNRPSIFAELSGESQDLKISPNPSMVRLRSPQVNSGQVFS